MGIHYTPCISCEIKIKPLRGLTYLAFAASEELFEGGVGVVGDNSDRGVLGNVQALRLDSKELLDRVEHFSSFLISIEFIILLVYLARAKQKHRVRVSCL